MALERDPHFRNADENEDEQGKDQRHLDERGASVGAVTGT
jgi:hypothetical protein